MFPDELDMRLLHELLADSRRSVRQLAKSLNESPSTIYNRVKRLKEKDIIKRYTIALDYTQLDMVTTAFVCIEIAATNGSSFNQEEIAKEISKIEGVYEVHLVSGEFDILCKIRANSIETIGEIVLKKIRRIKGVSRAKTNSVFKSVLEFGDLTSNV
ncbi:MAG: Lrp/AsnC family transcriptional regulator [Candidatus Heimdallarchaeota archaeon]|nr:Lrp/AsnC family transcriptional regulator [Candidatus Heimdallarchaeota archaeon]